jgi:hypothetical protein
MPCVVCELLSTSFRTLSVNRHIDLSAKYFVSTLHLYVRCTYNNGVVSALNKDLSQGIFKIARHQSWLTHCAKIYSILNTVAFVTSEAFCRKASGKHWVHTLGFSRAKQQWRQ